MSTTSIWLMFIYLFCCTTAAIPEKYASDDKISKDLLKKPSFGVTTFEAAFFVVASSIAAILAFLISFNLCHLFENCKNQLPTGYMDNNVLRKIQRKRSIDYIEPILVAIMDTFVENEMKATDQNVQETTQPIFNEPPMLVTLAKYFDKYADKEVKRHVKAMLFFVVHILGQLYKFLQSLVRYLGYYGIL
ncbi:hypothetical protein JTB14_011401 [Gonioctena quinquepunctata]|nr:hypothetical protein JTB14_011401 [Gonioctena quinquepunctata]